MGAAGGVVVGAGSGCCAPDARVLVVGGWKRRLVVVIVGGQELSCCCGGKGVCVGDGESSFLKAVVLAFGRLGAWGLFRGNFKGRRVRGNGRQPGSQGVFGLLGCTQPVLCGCRHP